MYHKTINDLWYEKTYISRLSQPTAFNWVTYILTQPFSDIKDTTFACPRQVHAKGEIMILSGNEIYDVPFLTVPTMKCFYITVVDNWIAHGHGMDIAVMFCSNHGNANSEYTSCIQS